MAARATALGDFGESAPRALGAAVRNLGRPRHPHGCRAGRGPAGGGARTWPRGVRRRCPAWRPSGARTATRRPTRRSPSASGTASAIRRSRGAAFPAAIRSSGRSKPASSCWATVDETGGFPPAPQPEVLGRNGTYVAFRKLHQSVAEFRRFLRANAAGREDEELLAAKMMGRWRSGAPLALCPLHDDPALGADSARNNAFLFRTDDALGYRTPPGSHIRRCNPRDSDVAGVVRLHRMIRRGTAYGPLAAGGRDRGRRRRAGPDVRLRRRAPEAPVRVRAVGVDQRRRFPGARRCEGPRRRRGRWRRFILDPPSADPPADPRPGHLRRHAWRRIRLHARSCARCAGSPTCPTTGGRDDRRAGRGGGPGRRDRGDPVRPARRAHDAGDQRRIWRHGGQRRSGPGAHAGPCRPADARGAAAARLRDRGGRAPARLPPSARPRGRGRSGCGRRIRPFGPRPKPRAP